MGGGTDEDAQMRVCRPAPRTVRGIGDGPATLLPATKRNHRTVRARGPDRCVRARRLGFETIADTVAHSAARLKAQPSKWAAMIDHTKFKSEMSCSNSRS